MMVRIHPGSQAEDPSSFDTTSRLGQSAIDPGLGPVGMCGRTSPSSGLRQKIRLSDQL